MGSKSAITEGLTIGRKHGDLILEDDAKMSGTHAKVEVDNKGQFVLRDQNSSNAMILDGRKVRKIALMPGVIFTIGSTQFRVVKDDVADPQVILKSIDSFEVPKAFEVPVHRAPLTWKEKIAEFWEQEEPMLSNSDDSEVRIEAFSPALVLDFIEGVQADQKITLGYGPRQAGFDHLDVDLQDPSVPEKAFELKPGPGHVELTDLSEGQVFVNNLPCAVTYLEEGDIISIGETKIKVRYL